MHFDLTQWLLSSSNQIKCCAKFLTFMGCKLIWAMEADGPGLAGARALKHAINGEHQTPSNARFSPSSLSFSLILLPSHIPHHIGRRPSVSQSIIWIVFVYVSFSIPINLFGIFGCSTLPHSTSPATPHCNWPPSGLFSECFLFASFFFCCSWLALSILCSVFKAAGKHSRANTSIESRCLLHF